MQPQMQNFRQRQVGLSNEDSTKATFKPGRKLQHWLQAAHNSLSSAASSGTKTLVVRDLKPVYVAETMFTGMISTCMWTMP